MDDQSIIFAGDSGNDEDFFISKYKSIIVKNVAKDFKDQILNTRIDFHQEDNLYIAQGSGSFDGNYSSGIIEGLLHFGWIGNIKIT